MEHRQGKRRLVNVPAVVETPLYGMQRVNITEVSLGGVYISWLGHTLTMYAQLVLRFNVCGKNAVEVYRWRGFVMHTTKDGVGMMFDSRNPRDREGVLALMTANNEVDDRLQIAS